MNSRTTRWLLSKGGVTKVAMEPQYVTALVDGEGSFCVWFNLKRLSTGIEVRPSFSITLNERDLEILKRIREYFNVGAIRYFRRDRCYKYEIRDIRNLVKVIIPQFEKFPLQKVQTNMRDGL